jgi:hypothetical protein
MSRIFINGASKMKKWSVSPTSHDTFSWPASEPKAIWSERNPKIHDPNHGPFLVYVYPHTKLHRRLELRRARRPEF